MNETKAYTAPNQTPTPSCLGDYNPRNGNTGTDSHPISKGDLPQQIFIPVNSDTPSTTSSPNSNDTKHGKSKNDNSVNSLTKVKLNEPFSALQPNDEVDSSLSPASTYVSHYRTSNNVIIGNNTRPKSGALSYNTINNTSLTNQWIFVDKPHQDASANQSDILEAVVVPHSDQDYPDIPEVV